MGIISELLRRAWDIFSVNYDKYIIDKSTAYPLVRNYENFEEALVLGIIKGLADRGEDITFIEAGSGTGRYMKILGYKITPHKEPKNNVYSYDENLSRHLKLIAGVDFSEKMIETTRRKLKRIVIEDGINMYDKLVQGNKLRLINEDIKNTSVDDILKGNEKRWTRVVCCMFGTFGNISEEDREEALKRMVEWRGSNGILIISLFNRDRLKDLGYYYYNAVRDLYGNPGFDYNKWDVTTDKNFLSHWYGLEEVEELAKKTDSQYKYIIIGDKLQVKNKIFDSQIGFIFISSNEEMKWLKGVLRALKGKEEVPENAITEVTGN